VVKIYGAQAKFVVENYGESALAAKFGVKRYPAIFVNDVLVATPKDFGFTAAGEGAEPGRYAPLRKAESHERFRADLKKVIDLLMAGKTTEASAMAAPADTGEVSRLPELSFTDLDGKAVRTADLAGKVVVVEFWATWCPPCRSTLAWLGELQKQYGDRVVVLAPAVESDEVLVRQLAAELKVPLRWGIRSPEMLAAFGDVSAVPTLLVFDGQGRLAGAHYGAPATLHQDVTATVTRALGAR
jgi:thiol-disulfide isomerase/thioredoxin